MELLLFSAEAKVGFIPRLKNLLFAEITPVCGLKTGIYYWIYEDNCSVRSGTTRAYFYC